MSVAANPGRGQDAPHSDARVIFGFSGDLATKQIFPALYRMVKTGALSVPVIGVASTSLGLDQLQRRVRNSIEQRSKIGDVAALSLLRYVSGDYKQPSTFAALKVLVQLHPPPQALFDASHPRGERANYVRFKLQPLSAVALAARVKRPGSWGPTTADALIADDGGWHNPTAEDEHAPGVTGALR